MRLIYLPLAVARLLYQITNLLLDHLFMQGNCEHMTVLSRCSEELDEFIDAARSEGDAFPIQALLLNEKARTLRVETWQESFKVDDDSVVVIYVSSLFGFHREIAVQMHKEYRA